MKLLTLLVSFVLSGSFAVPSTSFDPLRPWDQSAFFNGTCPQLCENKINWTEHNIEGIYYLTALIADGRSNLKCTYTNKTRKEGNVYDYSAYEVFKDTNQIRITKSLLELSDAGYLLKVSQYQLPFLFTSVFVTSEYIALVGCHECGFFSKAGAGFYGSIATRLAHPPCDTIERAKQDLYNCGLPREATIVRHDQSNCDFC